MEDAFSSGISHLSVLIRIRQQCLGDLGLAGRGDSQPKTLLLRGGDSGGYHRLTWGWPCVQGAW